MLKEWEIIMKKKTIIMLLLIIIIISACNSFNKVNEANVISEEEYPDNLDEEIPENSELPNEEIDLNLIKPNENGQIMILMYHGIGNEESEWVRTVSNFKKDLETLYKNNYRLISLLDYINNDIDVEAGFTPIILTFDDGLQNQFNYIDDKGTYIIDPKCAVGILEDYCNKNLDFGKAATFYIYYPVPFRQKDFLLEKLTFLVSNGYDIGNHGYNHENLGKISTKEVQESLAKNAESTKNILNDYVVESLALPYGAAPKGENYKHVVSGEHRGFIYKNRAVLKVGSNPAPAPNHINFDPSRLPRVRASEIFVNGTGLYDYLEYFEKNPGKKYISDGNKDTITIPKNELDNINMDSIDHKEVIIYDLETN